MIVKSFSGSPTPSNANATQVHPLRLGTVQTDTQAFLEAKASNSKALASKTDNYPIWR